MCGIVGGFWPNDRPDVPGLERALAKLAHRGRDDERLWIGNSAALGFRRLSLHGMGPRGMQPLHDPQSSVHLVANATLHRPPPHQSAAEAATAQRIGSSDCAALVPLYQRLGPDFGEEVLGPAAVAVYDEAGQRLVLWCDESGQKPLHYAVTPRGIVFASELAALLELTGRRTIDEEAAREFLLSGFLCGGRTLLPGLWRLLPGERLIFEANGALHRARIPAPREGFCGEHPPADPAELWASLQRAVADRQKVERPIGLLLSGGLDSAAVAAAVAASRRRDIKAYTLASADPRQDESTTAAATAAHCGLEHVLVPAIKDPSARLLALIKTSGEALSDASWIAADAVLEAAGKEVRAVLSGDGGDELLGGYRRHKAYALGAQMPAFLRHALSKLHPIGRGRWRPWLQSLRLPSPERLAALTGIGAEVDLVQRGLLRPKPIRQGASHESWLAHEISRLPGSAMERAKDPMAFAMAADFCAYLPFDLCPKADRAAMRHGVESFAPFLDREVQAVSARLPSHWQSLFSPSKAALREALIGRIPESVRRGKKRGFAVPLNRWLQAGPLRDLAESTFRADADFLDRFVPKSGEALLQAFDQGAKDSGPFLYALLVLALWKQEFSA